MPLCSYTVSQSSLSDLNLSNSHREPCQPRRSKSCSAIGAGWNPPGWRNWLNIQNCRWRGHHQSWFEATEQWDLRLLILMGRILDLVNVLGHDADFHRGECARIHLWRFRRDLWERLRSSCRRVWRHRICNKINCVHKPYIYTFLIFSGSGSWERCRVQTSRNYQVLAPGW